MREGYSKKHNSYYDYSGGDIQFEKERYEYPYVEATELEELEARYLNDLALKDKEIARLTEWIEKIRDAIK